MLALAAFQAFSRLTSDNGVILYLNLFAVGIKFLNLISTATFFTPENKSSAKELGETLLEIRNCLIEFVIFSSLYLLTLRVMA